MTKKSAKNDTKKAAASAKAGHRGERKGGANKAQEQVRDVRALVAGAALDLAARQGWAYTLLSDIAREAGLSMAELSAVVEDKGDVLALVWRRIDREMLEACVLPDPAVSHRDAVFDVLMTRFDVLNAHRAAMVSILESFQCDPKQLVLSCPHLGRSMNWVLEAAGIDTQGVRGALRLAGLAALYLKALRVWKDDESADLAKVMAALDKDLARVETLADRLGL